MEQVRKFSLSAVFLGTGIFLAYASQLIDIKGADYIVSPRAVPLGLSSIMTVLAVWSLILDIRKRPKPGAGLDFGAMRSIAGFLAIVLAYVLLMGTVDFHVLTFLFLIVSFYYFGVRSLVPALGVAACLVAAEFLIFQLGFQVFFP